MTTETITLIALLITTAGGWVTLLLKMKQDRQNREEDRKDKRLEAELTAKYRKDLKQEVITTKAVAATGVRKAAEAINTSNGIKQALMDNGVKLITEEPLKVTVENTHDHPVPTESH